MTQQDKIERLRAYRVTLLHVHLACFVVVDAVTVRGHPRRAASETPSPDFSAEAYAKSALVYRPYRQIPYLAREEEPPAEPAGVERRIAENVKAQLELVLPPLLGGTAQGLAERFVRCLAHMPGEAGPMSKEDAQASAELIKAIRQRVEEARRPVEDCIVWCKVETQFRAAGLEFPVGRWLSEQERQEWGRVVGKAWDRVNGQIEFGLNLLGWDERGGVHGVPVMPPAPKGHQWTRLERAILEALYYEGLKLEELDGWVDKGTPKHRPRLGWKNDSRRTVWSYEAIRKATVPGSWLRKSGAVQQQKAVGYFRPDAPPGQRPSEEKISAK